MREKALRVLGLFKRDGGYYFRIVWMNHSRVISGRSYEVVNRWRKKLQRKISDGKL